MRPENKELEAKDWATLLQTNTVVYYRGRAKETTSSRVSRHAFGKT